MKVNKLFTLSIVLMLFCTGSVWAKTGKLYGNVELKAGYILPGVTVHLTAGEKGKSYKALSGEDGKYSITGIPAGKYQLTFELLGLRTILLKEIQIAPEQKKELNVTMKVARLWEELMVWGERKKKKEKPKVAFVAREGRVATLRKPKLVKMKKPVYPEEVQEEGIEEVVVIRAEMNEKGILTNMKVKKGECAALVEAAIDDFDLLYFVGNVSAVDSPVLLLGETGAGKDLLARAIHQASGRSASTARMETVSQRRLAPDMNSAPSTMAPNTSDVPRSGWMSTSASSGPTTRPAPRNVRKLAMSWERVAR